MDFGTNIKGLENEVGENNCFVNVIVQMLSHLQSFKNFFSMLSYDHNHAEETLCLVCEVRVIFI